MGQRIQTSFVNRASLRVEHRNGVVRAKHSRRGMRSSKRARGVPRNERLPFVPPENWHEPRETAATNAANYKIVVQSPGLGYRHIVTPEEIRQRLAQLPEHFVKPLEVVQLSRMTRKKLSFPCYGMQWGPSIYLYPVEESLVERYNSPPKPNQVTEARMFGGRWEHTADGFWQLVWTDDAIKNFYLNNILIHELGHILDQRNSRTADRERYAEWFALEYGYKPTRRLYIPPQPVVRRHHAVTVSG